MATPAPVELIPSLPPLALTPAQRGEGVAGLYPGDILAPWVALTFDDGPRPDWTPRVLRMLSRYGVTATFFVVGRLVKQHPHLIRQIVAEGHELGNHSYTHRSLGSLSPRAIEKELFATQQAVDHALGYHYPMHLVRPPFGAPWFGAWDAQDRRKVARVLRQQGKFCILWHIGTADTRPTCNLKSVVASLDRAIIRNRGGAVIFHPTSCAKKSIRAVLRMLQQRGVATASPLHLLEAKYGCGWREIGQLPIRA